jgi:hypothetical protein
MEQVAEKRETQRLIGTDGQGQADRQKHGKIAASQERKACKAQGPAPVDRNLTVYHVEMHDLSQQAQGKQDEEELELISSEVVLSHTHTSRFAVTRATAPEPVGRARPTATPASSRNPRPVVYSSN